MTRDFFDPTAEQQNVVLVDVAILQKAQRMIAGCETCSEDGELPFENILDRLTGSDPAVTITFWKFRPAVCSVGPRLMKSVQTINLYGLLSVQSSSGSMIVKHGRP